MSELGGGAPRRSNWVALTVGIVGGMLLIGTASSAAVAGVAASASVGSSASGVSGGVSGGLVGGADIQGADGRTKQLLTFDAKGITGIDVEASAARFSISCNTALAIGDSSGESGGGESSEGKNSAGESGAGDSFALYVGTGSREWRMVQRGDTLTVEPVKRWFEGFWFFGIGRQGMQDVALSLPASVCAGENPIDAALQLDSGKLQVDGVFGELDLKVNAGGARVDGSASALDVDLNAGELTLNLSDVHVADLSVSAGDLWGNFDGDAPKQMTVDVSAGSADLRLPDEIYSVRSKVEIGDFENLLRTDNGSKARQIDVDLSVGDVKLSALK